MKAQSIEWGRVEHINSANELEPAKRLNRVTSLARRSIFAAVPALAVVVGAAWLVGMTDLIVYLQATLWASGFVFFGLALDSEKSTIGLSVATGFALPALALLSSRVAAEYAIVAAVIVAAWLAAAIWRSRSRSGAGLPAQDGPPAGEVEQPHQ